jgi:hypothetical protein
MFLNVWGVVVKECTIQKEGEIIGTQPWCLSQRGFILPIASIDTLIESYSSKSESQPVKYYLGKSLKVFGFKYT